MILKTVILLSIFVTINAQVLGQFGAGLGSLAHLGSLAGRHAGLIDRDAIFDIDHPLADVDGFIGNTLLTARGAGLGFDTGLSRGVGLQTGLSRGAVNLQRNAGISARANIDLHGANSFGLQSNLGAGNSDIFSQRHTGHAGIGSLSRHNIHGNQGLGLSSSSRNINLRNTGGSARLSAGFQSSTGGRNHFNQRSGGSLSQHHLRRQG